MANAPLYRNKWPVYARQWDAMRIKAGREAEIADFCRRALAGKARYQRVEAKSGVPWWMVAIIAERESGQDWSRSLAQGDPWNRKSTHVPKGRGPFPSWEAAALDALHIDNLDLVTDWRLEKVLYYLEKYNGFGYHNRGLPSPYIWGATTIQKPGKYTSDGRFNPNAWDRQLGAAAMLRGLMDRDSTIQPIKED